MMMAVLVEEDTNSVVSCTVHWSVLPVEKNGGFPNIMLLACVSSHSPTVDWDNLGRNGDVHTATRASRHPRRNRSQAIWSVLFILCLLVHILYYSQSFMCQGGGKQQQEQESLYILQIVKDTNDPTIWPHPDFQRLIFSTCDSVPLRPSSSWNTR